MNWLTDYIERGVQAFRAAWTFEGPVAAADVFIRYGWPLLLLIVVGALLIGAWRRQARRRQRRKRIQRIQKQQQSLVVDDYRDNVRGQIHKIAEELATQPGNPQPVVLPDGRREIAREGLGGLANRLFDLLLEEVHGLGGNEIHIDRSPTATTVQYRISGLRQDQHELPRHLYPILHNVAKGRTGLQLGEENLNENAFFLHPLGEQDRRINVMIYAGDGEPSLVLRIAPVTWQHSRFVDLGMSSSQVQEFGELLLSSTGLLLVVGPRHSGKTSLGYAALHQFTSGPRKAIALEDRPLTELPGIRQLPLIHLAGNERISRLQRVIRDSPDVLFLDCYLPDYLARETINSMILEDLVIQTVATARTANYLHLVAQSVADPDALMKGILAVVECRLVRKTCPDCPAETRPTKAEQRLFEKTLKPRETFTRGQGCARCNMTGYRGVTGLFAIVHPEEHLMRLVRNEISAPQFNQYWNQKTRQTLERNGVALARQSITTLEEVVRILSRSDLEQEDRRTKIDR